MSDPRAVLQDIQQRADATHWVIATDPDGSVLRESSDDVPKLVAALRAVLAYADSIDHPDHRENEEGTDTCRTCRQHTLGRAPWPCVYRRHAEEIRAAITEALGGTDA